MNYKSLARSRAIELHRDWVNTMLEAKQATSNSAREINIEHLVDLHKSALELNSEYFQYLTPVQAGQIKHIVQRPIDQHIAVVRSNKTNVIGTF